MQESNQNQVNLSEIIDLAQITNLYAKFSEELISANQQLQVANQNFENVRIRLAQVQADNTAEAQAKAEAEAAQAGADAAEESDVDSENAADANHGDDTERKIDVQDESDRES